MFLSGVDSVTALRIARYQAQALRAVDTSAARIASGRRFSSFAEDPVAATREISLRSQQGATGLYLKATQQAVSASGAAADGLQSALDVLTEMRNAVLGLNSADPTSVTAVQQSVAGLSGELNRIGKATTTDDGTKLLDGSLAVTPLSFTVGRSGSASDTVQLNAAAVDASVLGSNTLKLDAIDFSAGTPTTQADALAAIDAARATLTSSMTAAGAVSSAMTYHVAVLGRQSDVIDTAIENLVGVDTAQETLELTRHQIVAEAAGAMLAQTNALHVSMMRQLLSSLN